MNRVLVLSNAFMPLTTVSPQRAVKLLYLGKVVVEVETEIEWTSISVSIKIPAVIRLIKDLKHKFWIGSRLSRKNILMRDDWRCQYCGDEPHLSEITIDHILPSSRGGETTWENVVAACVDCNKKKDNKTPREAKMSLNRKPKEPSMMLLSVKIQRSTRNIPENWLDYFYWYGMLEKK